MKVKCHTFWILIRQVLVDQKVDYCSRTTCFIKFELTKGTFSLFTKCRRLIHRGLKFFQAVWIPNRWCLFSVRNFIIFNCGLSLIFINNLNISKPTYIRGFVTNLYIRKKTSENQYVWQNLSNEFFTKSLVPPRLQIVTWLLMRKLTDRSSQLVAHYLTVEICYNQ